MNRIYQGRVSNVEIPDGKDEKWKPLYNWQNILWQHHELFQDAVNYYTFAISALADGLPSNHPLIALRKRAADAWQQFPRKTSSPAKNLRDSVYSWLGLPRDSTFDDALKIFAVPSPKQKEVRALAAALLAEMADKLKPQKCANSYWGRYCDRLKKEPNWDYSREEHTRKSAASDWIASLWLDDAGQNIQNLAESLKLPSLVKCDPAAAKISEAEARSLLTDAFNHLKGIVNGTLNDTKPAKKTNGWLRQNKKTVQQFLEENANLVAAVKACGLISEKARGGGIDINKTHAAALFKAFPRSFTFEYVRAAVPKPKVKKQTKSKEQPRLWEIIEAKIRQLGDDPIRLARRDNKPIFRAFTALNGWKTIDDNPCWPDFDKCAFEEALKTINQFNQKTEDREKRRLETEAELKYMMGENADWKPKKENEEADDREVSILGGDPRYEKLLTLLQDLDEESAERTTKKIYGPSHSSLRGFGKLRDAWLDLFTAASGHPDEAKLREAVADLQREQKLDMGYTTFFLKLCEADYWELWRDDTESEAKERRTKKWARSVIYAAADARELAEEFERLQEPIRYTPAEPEHSRRLFMFSDIGGTHAAKYKKPGVVEVSVAKSVESKYSPQRLLLHYSAPRLIRDHLSDGSHAKWLQPMMVALGLPNDALAGFTKDRNGEPKDSAVALMPDFVGRKRELRMLLNFPVDLDTSTLIEKIGKTSLWDKQINQSFENGKIKQRFHLFWPGMENEPEKGWWDNPKVRSKGISCLSIDLSQRRAADFALIHAQMNRTPKAFVELGEAGGRSWFASLAAAGSLRLPGEDAEVFRDGIKQMELSGKRGRNATELEYQSALNLATKLLHDEDAVQLESKTRNWLGADKEKYSFPEQSDKLLNLFHGALSRYRTWHRWSWKLTPEHKKEWDKTIKEIQNVPYFAAWSELASNAPSASSIGNLQQLIATAAEGLRLFLQEAVLAMAHTVLPLRENTWRWIEYGKDSKEKPLHVLISDGLAPQEKPWLRGQRGLSLARIEQLENFRRAVLSLNRLLRHEVGVKPEFGSQTRGESLPDPCPEITDKINRMKEDRVNQTAHLIVAQALGVRLKYDGSQDEDRENADIHGEYELIPGRSPVDLIVLEDLSRYTTDKSRSRSENSRLMKWCHRAINEKVKLLIEPFGIPVLEVFASYSSKFDSRTGAPGFRAIEVTIADRFFWQKTIEKQPVARAVFDCLDSLAAKNNKNVRLILPQNGGPLFVPAVKSSQPLPPVRQADINAAVNIGLRAIAGPSCYHAHPRVRLAKAKSGANKGKWFTRLDNKREKAQFDSKPAEIVFGNLKTDSEVLKGDNTNLFHDPLKISAFGYATIDGTKHPPLAHASALLSRQKNSAGKPNGAVARLEWEVCRRINIERLKKLGCDFSPLADKQNAESPITDEEDDVPM
jgi:hypothetical protein